MPQPNEPTTVGGIVSKIVAAVTPATAPEPVTDLTAMRDPRSAYPGPPFDRTAQAVPGLAADMDPKPDHGETTYVGHGRLRGRRALVTGGDSGLGRAAVIAFAREGADVAISYLPSEEADAQEVLALVRAAGRRGVGLPGDITSEATCQRLVADAVRELGGLDILVNNAGKQHAVESILDLSTEQFDLTFKTNVYAPFWITKAAVPHLPPGASIINTASSQAFKPSAILLDYASTKGAVVVFTKALAAQLLEKGIRVNAVVPGPFWTALEVSGGQPPKNVAKFGAEVPMGRPGQPVELAPVYVLLASQESSYATGQVYGATGGMGIP